MEDKAKRAGTGPLSALTRGMGAVFRLKIQIHSSEKLSLKLTFMQPLGDVSWTVGGYSEQASCCRDVTEYDGVGHMMAALWELPYNYLNWLGISRFGEASLPSYNSTVYLSK
jgi:hypothetical protein